MKPLVLVCCVALVFSCQSPKNQSSQFEPLDFPGKGNYSLPVLFADEQGLLLSYVETIDDTTARLFYSRLENGAFSPAQKITQGNDWFVNWADFPAVVQNRENLLAHILRKSSPTTYSYDIKLQVLPQGETEWTTALPLHQDSTLTEHGFLSAVPYTDSTYFLSWLDGRDTGGAEHDHSGHSGAMTLRAAEVDFEGTVLWDELLDARVCDCCQTSAAISSKGPVVVYRNRSDREIRDIAITRLVDGQWTEPRTIHPEGWEIRGCPVNGPKVTALQQTLLVAWFTDINQEAQVKISFSSDAGESFGPAQNIGTRGSVGRVDVSLLDQNNGLVSWMGLENDTTFLYVKQVSKSGQEFPIRRITAMDPTRKSGFPQMERFQDKIYFAWTQVEGDKKSIALTSLPIEAL